MKVAEGFPTDFLVTRNGNLISISRVSLDRFEIFNLDYTFIQDASSMVLPTAADAETYLTQVFSPFTALGENNITKVMDCDSSVAIDDWVYQSLTTNCYAEKAADNNPPQPVIGKVIAKPTSTQAEVVVSGIVSDSSVRGRLFLDGSGVASTTPPVLGFVQRIGVSFGDGTILVNPELHRVKKV